jgi:RNase_H superfamily
MNYVTFDIETYSPGELKKIDTNEFRVSVIGAYCSWLDKYLVFLEDDVTAFLNILKECDLVVGYNHLWFDLPVLQKYANFDLKQLPTFDIMTEMESQIGYKLKLNDLCKANFDDDIKTDSYETYSKYYKESKWLELIDYCMNDVRLTEGLFQKVLDAKPLHYFDLHFKKEALLPKPTGQRVDVKEVSESIF